MSEIQHSTRSHARLNASSSHRWMMCPPSVKLSEQFADKPSPYAEEGTFLHELCELKLHRYLGDMTPEVLEAQYAAHRDSDFYSDEAESVTDEYVSFCVETIEAVRASCPDPLILVEHRLDYSEYVPGGGLARAIWSSWRTVCWRSLISRAGAACGWKRSATASSCCTVWARFWSLTRCTISAPCA